MAPYGTAHQLLQTRTGKSLADPYLTLLPWMLFNPGVELVDLLLNSLLYICITTLCLDSGPCFQWESTLLQQAPMT